ncbi:hypothetical protein AVEN_161962-1 [Araneus ventricosus]|uniref:STPR domain-containing protein n=1 Tax=Araneus ventricosus TaxID=182803 RepID=A0A4Y2X0A5_ARAVE|nr:hypothetical protein AVEN_161962-1 [Araneus ventricosus]
MPERKREITGDVASKREAIRKRERRVVETEEERSRRLSTMAQHGQDRRAKETEEQRNSRLSDMAQRGQERRAEETEEQRKRIRFGGKWNTPLPKRCTKVFPDWGVAQHPRLEALTLEVLPLAPPLIEVDKDCDVSLSSFPSSSFSISPVISV